LTLQNTEPVSEQIHAAITAVSGYFPDYVLTNQELSKMVDTNDEWIVSRTGIRERRLLKNGATSDMAAKAVELLLKKRGIQASEIDLIICATVTADMMFPATANIISDKVGAVNAWSFDLGAACCGFLYALSVGSKFVETGAHKKVVVVGADKMSSIVDYTERSTCIIFGDAAGAVLLEPTQEPLGIMDSILKTDGTGRELLYQKAGGSLFPATIETVRNKEHYIKQDGRAVYKYAVTNMAEVSLELMERNHLQASDVTWLVPHQANRRIIESTAERLGLSMERVTMNIEKYGNTTSATIPLCLWEWEHRFKKNDTLVLAAFGGGFTWGAIYVKWAYDSE